MKESGELEKLIRGLARAREQSNRPDPPSGVNMAPGCAFGAVVEQRLTDMERGFGELKARLNHLIFVVVGAVLVEVIMRIVG